MVKKIAVYGAYETKVPVRQRYRQWIYHRRGTKAGQKWYKKRVWKTTKRMKKEERKGRYEFTGKGRDLYKAVLIAQKIVPKGFVIVPAEKFLDRPEEYGVEGEWVDRPEIES